MKRIDFAKVLELTMLATMWISGCLSVMAQQQAPARPQSTREPAPLGSAANAATAVRLPSGTVTGFVYWQMNVFQPQSDCQGLTVKIITVNNSGMPLQLLSTTSSLTVSGPMTDYSAMGAPKYMLCSYSFQNMPEKVSLRTLLYGMPTTVSVALPAAFQISGGNCNSTPSSTLSFILTGGPMLCGNGAYNINFKLTASAASTARSPENSTLLRNIDGGQPHGLLEQSAAQNSHVSGPATGVTGGSPLLASQPGVGSSSASPSNNAALPKNGSQASAGATNLARQSAAGTPPGATRQTLTNADVLKMMKGGVPESVIVSSIQSTAHKFDFSLARCQELKAAHVTGQILDAMGDGRTRPCSASGLPGRTLMVPSEQKTPVGSQTAGPGDGRGKAGELNPRSAPQPSKTRDPEVLRLLQKPGTAKIGPVVKSPRAARENAAITAFLQKQRSAADLEVAQMKLSLQPASLTGGPSQLMSAPGSAGSSGEFPGAGGNLSAGTLQTSSGGSSGQKGNIPSSVVHGQSFKNTAIICSTDPTFRILNVSSSADPATFTPIEQYNLYTITGCSFGDTSGNVSIYGTGSFQENFIVKFWSEDAIVVSLDPNLSGLPDLDNITLVVQRNDKHQTQKPGFKFYAARQKVPLKQIPKSWVQFEDVWTDTDGNDDTPIYAEYSSPPPMPPGPSAGTSYVSRFSPDGKFYAISGNDYYDFSQLAPGWTTDSFQVTTYALSCPWVVTYRQDIWVWNWDWDTQNPNNIDVGTGSTSCSGFNPLIPLQNYQDRSGSFYTLQVWVAGPLGLDPFTNQLVSQ